jgi:hypothetical protein
MSDGALRLRAEFYRTAALNGMKIISDDKCCRLLAWLYVYGGGNEQVIEGKLSGHIMYAQARLNIDGGEIPDGELLPVLKHYINDITGADKNGFYHDTKNKKYRSPPEWVIELENEYGIEAHGRNG